MSRPFQVGRSRSPLEKGFPFLPAGSSVDLDTVAQDAVLRSIRKSLPSTWRARVAELRSLGNVDLSTFLLESGLDLDDVYVSNRGWTDLRRAAGLPTQPPGPKEAPLLRAVGRLTHVDDPERIATYLELLSARQPLNPFAVDERRSRLARMLIGSISDLPATASVAAGAEQLWQHPQVRDELVQLLHVLADRIGHLDSPLGLNDDIPLRVHARYTRREILAAFGSGSGLRAPSWQEGVRWLPDVPADIFAFTLDKTAGSFSPTTRYRDYALSADLIHWESQSATSVSSATGQRYLHHAERGSHVILFGRLDVTQRSFRCLGPASYVKHDGDRPIALTWKLSYRLPADLYAAFAAAVA